MDEATHRSQDYTILATASRADERTRVIKHGESFAVFDHAGTIRQGGIGELGIYHEGTRFLSRFEIALERRRPLLLGSTVRSDNVLLVDYANPDMPEFRGGPLLRDTVHLFASSFLWNGTWYARIRLHNFGMAELELELSLLFAADFVDIFEVRGMRREQRGELREPVVGSEHVTLGYEGLDRLTRTTELVFAPAPALLTRSRAEFHVALAPRAEAVIEIRAAFTGSERPEPVTHEQACDRSRERLAERRASFGSVTTSNPELDAWIARSAGDLEMMITDTPHGPYPYAGVPWFSTAFGRDGIITALELLWLDPQLARGVLAFLAATQATAHDREQDAEPGKIIHETRLGEMAALREVPFGRYYGSVDATPLFVMLAGAYWRRTADRATIEQLWPQIAAALAWIDDSGDCDHDGFVEYARRSPRGLVSQGWKDSHDSISRRDGELADGPIALCEVQGYTFAARRAGAELARVLGHAERAEQLERAAEGLREQFERAFWCEDLGTYALALDGEKRRCAVRASNAGHCLWTGIAGPVRARRTAQALLEERSFSGWGVRTLDAGEARYNPISYHNGSVWPHDNAIIALGMARYGFKHGVVQITNGLFEAIHHFDLWRMPELFCGFRQRPHEGPTLYPVACAPQAWSAGAVFMLLQACLGLEVDATRRCVYFDRPVLPAGLEQLAIRNLAVGEGRVDIVVERYQREVGVHLDRRDGDVEVVVVM
jgi:glycogen debranching enzyme